MVKAKVSGTKNRGAENGAGVKDADGSPVAYAAQFDELNEALGDGSRPAGDTPTDHGASDATNYADDGQTVVMQSSDQPAADPFAGLDDPMADDAGASADEASPPDAPPDAPPAVDPSPTPTAAEKQRTRYACQIHEAEQRLVDASMRYYRLRDDTKAAKKQMEAAAEELQELRDNPVDMQMPLFDGDAAAATLHTGAACAGASVGNDGSAADGHAADSNAAPASRDPDVWRRASISELGLPPKMTEALIEAGIATIGALEDRRATPKGLRSVPGIGPAKVDRITDAAVGWLSIHRDQHALSEAAGSNAAASVSEGDVDAAANPADNAVESDASDAPASSHTGADDNRAANPADDRGDIAARAAAINTGKENCLTAALQDERFWDSGYEACERGDAMLDCPLVAGPEQDDWLRGWLAAEVLAAHG